MRTLLAAALLSIAAMTCHAGLPLYQAPEDMHADAARRVAAGQFEGLVADADRHLKTEERFTDGRWKLAVLRWGVGHALEHGNLSHAAWVRDEAAVTALANKRPDPPNGWLMVAALEDRRAWAARDNGYSSELDRMQEGRFDQYSAKASRLLMAHPAPGNPAWHAESLSVEADRGASPKALDEMFAEAIKHSPDYQQTWFTRLHYLEPKWGGSLDDMVDLVDLASSWTSAAEGRGMMARLLWAASKEGYDEPLADPKISWDAVKAYFEDVLRHYPDDWNTQWFFIQACKRGDKAEAAHLLAFVKQPPSNALFEPSGVPFDGCAAWANRKANSFMMLAPATGQPRRIR